jgi:hypothetical protein
MAPSARREMKASALAFLIATRLVPSSNVRRYSENADSHPTRAAPFSKSRETQIPFGDNAVSQALSGQGGGLHTDCLCLGKYSDAFSLNGL